MVKIKGTKSKISGLQPKLKIHGGHLLFMPISEQFGVQKTKTIPFFVVFLKYNWKQKMQTLRWATPGGDQLDWCRTHKIKE